MAEGNYENYDSSNEDNMPVPTTPTSPGDGESPAPTEPAVLCFRNDDQIAKYDGFSQNAANVILAGICEQSGSVFPPDAPAIVQGDETGLRGSLSWAQDQTGCNPKSEAPLHDRCLESFLNLGEACDTRFREPFYGGATILDGPWGCLTIYLGDLKDSIQSIQGGENNDTVTHGNLTGPALATHLAMLEQLEPDLPHANPSEFAQHPGNLTYVGSLAALVVLVIKAKVGQKLSSS